MAISDIVKYEKEFTYEFESSYSDIQKIEYLLKKLEIAQVERNFLGDKVAWKIVTNEYKLNSFKEDRCTR